MTGKTQEKEVPFGPPVTVTVLLTKSVGRPDQIFPRNSPCRLNFKLFLF